MVEIEVQKARQGDCIWLRCVAEKSVNVVIDAETTMDELEIK